MLVAAAGWGCARAVSYLDPAGPLHAYRPGPGEGEAGAPRLPPRPGAPWRVVSFNVAYAIEIERAIEVLRETPELRAPDVLALQEMDAPGTERIARALGLHAVYFPSGVHPKHRRDFGCAILSPWPLEAPRKIVLPHGARVTGLRRAVTVATVRRGGERLRAYSLHLPAPLSISGRSRRAQLRVVGEDARVADGPVVIAGDFNSHRKAGELTRDGFAWATREAGDTTSFRVLGVRLGGLSYDHVLVRGLEPVATGVVKDNRGASDHQPIWALLAAPPR